jgi:hypothetical protein
MSDPRLTDAQLKVSVNIDGDIVLALPNDILILDVESAEHLGQDLLKHAANARLVEAPRQAQPSLAPPDRSKRCMLSGEKETPEHREIDPATGMQKDYVVLCPDERAKGFVRPVRRTYLHTPCGTTTTMGLALAETYARDPGFYSGTFCVHCCAHFPLDQFVWDGTDEQVGS